jgi:hypothetical protein
MDKCGILIAYDLSKRIQGALYILPFSSSSLCPEISEREESVLETNEE